MNVVIDHEIQIRILTDVVDGPLIKCTGTTQYSRAYMKRFMDVEEARIVC